MSRLKLVGAFLLTLVLVGCGRVQPVLNVEDTPVGVELTQEQVKDVIKRAATERGWIVTEKSANELSAKILVRSHSAEVSIPYNEKFYSIIYVTSSNLKATEGKIHRNYNRWVNNLNVDIQRDLSVIAASQ